MNISIIPLLAGVTLLCGTSCDVPGRLIVKNRTDQQVILVGLPATRSVDSLVLQIEPNSEAGKLFGFGHSWSDPEIEEYVSRYTQILIVHGVDTTRLITFQERAAYFRDRVRGIRNKEVRIIISD